MRGATSAVLYYVTQRWLKLGTDFSTLHFCCIEVSLIKTMEVHKVFVKTITDRFNENSRFEKIRFEIKKILIKNISPKIIILDKDRRAADNGFQQNAFD